MPPPADWSEPVGAEEPVRQVLPRQEGPTLIGVAEFLDLDTLALGTSCGVRCDAAGANPGHPSDDGLAIP